MKVVSFINVILFTVLSFLLVSCFATPDKPGKPLTSHSKPVDFSSLNSRQQSDNNPITITHKKESNKNEVLIAIGGKWDDRWGETGATQKSLAIGATHDVILMAGDLSYDSKDGDLYNGNI